MIKKIISLINLIIDDENFSACIIDNYISSIIKKDICSKLNLYKHVPMYYDTLDSRTRGRHIYLKRNNTSIIVKINKDLSFTSIAKYYKADKNLAIHYFEAVCQTIAHEYRHVWQKTNKKYLYKDYIDASLDYEGYYNQDSEKDARNWAFLFWKENSERLLNTIFNLLNNLYIDLLEDDDDSWE